MQRILFLENKMQEDAASQERTQEGQLTRLNPISGEDSGHTSILYQERTVDTPQSYVRRGQWTHLNPMSGEDSGHTSILCQERTVNTPQSWPGENSEHRIQYLHIRRGHTSILWKRNISIPNNGPSGVQDSKTPRLQASN